MQFTNEQLCQLIDGELSVAEESEMRAAMASDDVLAERFAVLAVADARYKNTISVIDESPIPESILALLSEDQLAARRSGASSETSALQSARSLSQSIGAAMARAVSPPPTYLAMAFTFLFAGVFTALLWGTNNGANRLEVEEALYAVRYGVLPPENPVVKVLSNTPSGSTQQLALRSDSAATVTPVLSFASTTGDFCREYTLNLSESSHRAVACRQDQGWRVVLSTRTDAHQSSVEYQTASAISPSAFEEKINLLIHSDPLSYQEELLMIERGWESKQTAK